MKKSWLDYFNESGICSYTLLCQAFCSSLKKNYSLNITLNKDRRKLKTTLSAISVRAKFY
jgi:hypothetical protein